MDSEIDHVACLRSVTYERLRLSMQNGIIIVAPPVVTRAYQELSRGIVNLQNASGLKRSTSEKS